MEKSYLNIVYWSEFEEAVNAVVSSYLQGEDSYDYDSDSKSVQVRLIDFFMDRRLIYECVMKDGNGSKLESLEPEIHVDKDFENGSITIKVPDRNLRLFKYLPDVISTSYTPQSIRWVGDPTPRHIWANDSRTKYIKIGSTEDHEIWLDLFLDLIHVAMFSKIGYVLLRCGVDDYVTLLWAMGIFVAVFNSRYLIDEYSNIFFVNDYFHRVFYFFYFIGLLLMAFNVYTFDYVDYHVSRRLAFDDLFSDTACTQQGVDIRFNIEFSIGFITTRLAVLFMYVRASLQDKKCKEQFQVIIVILFLSVVLVLVKMIDGKQTLLFVAVMLEATGRFFQPLFYKMSTMFRSRFLTFVPVYIVHFPLDVYRLQSRLGLFMAMVLGEALLSIVTVSPQTQEPTFRNFNFQVCSGTVMFGLALLYYDSVQLAGGSDRALVRHALERDALAGQLWVWLHITIGFSIFIAGVGLSLQYTNVVVATSVDAQYAWTVSVALAVTDLMFIWMRTLHGGFRKLRDESAQEYRFRLGVDVCCRCVFPLAHLAVYGLRSDRMRERDAEIELDRDITLHMCIVIANNAFDIFCKLNYLALLSLRFGISSPHPSRDGDPRPLGSFDRRSSGRDAMHFCPFDRNSLDYHSSAADSMLSDEFGRSFKARRNKTKLLRDGNAADADSPVQTVGLITERLIPS